MGDSFSDSRKLWVPRGKLDKTSGVEEISSLLNIQGCERQSWATFMSPSLLWIERNVLHERRLHGTRGCSQSWVEYSSIRGLGSWWSSRCRGSCGLCGGREWWEVG